MSAGSTRIAENEKQTRRSSLYNLILPKPCIYGGTSKLSKSLKKIAISILIHITEYHKAKLGIMEGPNLEELISNVSKMERAPHNSPLTFSSEMHFISILRHTAIDVVSD